MANKFKFDVVLTNFKRGENDLAKLIANANKNYYVASFTKQSYNGKPWKEVQRRIKGTQPYKYPKKRGLSRRTKPILIGKGVLRRAVSNSIKSATFKRIEWNVPLPYAEVHNDGLNGMPKRRFMGWNKDNDRITRDIMTKWGKGILNKRS